MRRSLRDKLPSLVCVHCPLSFPPGVRGPSGVTAQKYPFALEPCGASDILSVAQASQELPGSKDSAAPGLGWGPSGDARDTFQRPAGGSPSTFFPKGLIVSEPLAAASPGPRWGAGSPSTTAHWLVPRWRGLPPERLGPAGPGAVGRGRPRGPGSAAIVRGRVSAGRRAPRVCTERGQGGAPRFLRDYFLIWLLC